MCRMFIARLFELSLTLGKETGPALIEQGPPWDRYRLFLTWPARRLQRPLGISCCVRSMIAMKDL